MELKIGEKYTTFDISSFMACTVKREIVIKNKIDGKYVFALKGKRKQFYLSRTERENKSLAIFEGHDLDLICDGDYTIVNANGTTCRSFSGNALLNFVGTVDSVKDWIENKNLNPDLDKGIIVANEDPSKENNELMVYPEIAEVRGHAVADRILNRQMVTA